MKKQTGLWIEHEILFSDLTLVEKCILADIINISRYDNMYYKTNDVIGLSLSSSPSTIKRAIKSLIGLGLISSIVWCPYGSHIKKRVLRPNYKEIREYFNLAKGQNDPTKRSK